ncbi:electron transfer flavoprotein subunit beta/FixA family protein [Gemmatimonas aurantiaca]|nr:electron transfer flavoprotein subunit beta/FixA family protein [Gemmatimonas aurantiaca]
MKFVVLMKQTPDVSLVKVNADAGEIELPVSGGTVNPYDEYPVEEVIRLKERFGGTSVALCVGSEKSESSLRDCLALGVDEAYLACDPLFEGSDSQANARILAAALTKLGDYTVILGGKQSADNESGQTPAAIAALLDLPGIGAVKKISDISGDTITMERVTDDGFDVIETTIPVVASCVKEIADPRLPSLKGKMAAKKKTIIRWSAADLGLDGSGIGDKSATKRVKVSPPQPRPAGEFIEGETPAVIADNLYQKLKTDQAL